MSEKQPELTPFELELLGALEKANWFIHDMMYNDTSNRFREQQLLPLINRGRAQIEKDRQEALRMR